MGVEEMWLAYGEMDEGLGPDCLSFAYAWMVCK